MISCDKNKKTMKRINLISLLGLTLALLFFQCSKENIGPEDREGEATLNAAGQPELRLLSDANNDFGLDLFRRLNDGAPEENVFISPTSIATALSMTMNGAAGQTLVDMRQALKQSGLNLDELNAANKVLLAALPNMDISVQATMANSIWYRDDFPVKENFTATNETYYDSEVRPLDFTAPGAKDIINEWVEDKTAGRIKDMVNQIKREDIMFLINAIYFKGDWKASFDEEKTAPAPFTLVDNSSVQVDMMRLGTFALPYFSTDALHIIDLAYGDGDAFAMTILLPRGKTSPDDLLNTMTIADWNNWTDGLTKREIDFAMPKFRMEYNKKLNDELKEMGMQRAFDEQAADFSNISESAQLFISAVQHKSFIEVNESGAEAAAATSVTVGTTSAGPGQPLTIRVDRPFLFAIREKQANNILFLGKMMNPTNK